MSNMNNMNNIMMKLFMVILLMMFSMGVNAKVDVELNKEYKGGKVKVKSQEDNPDGSTLVTITVTPDQGFTITHSDKEKGVIVVAVRPTGSQSGTRAPQIAGDLDVKGPTETVSYPNSVDYQFTVPAGLNAWVQEIKFQEKRGGSKYTTPVNLGFSGTYYIASKSTRENNANNKYTYDPGSPAGNYYLCPTKDWYFYKSTDPFYQESDNGQPFLTTYKIRNSNDADADPTEAVWVLEKHPTETNCYYVRQRKTTNNGKYRYMVSNVAINVGTRMRVHLEEVADDDALADLGDLALFEFIFNTTNNYWEIKPHSAEGKFDDNGTMRDYLVVNNGNYNQFKGHKDKTGGPDGSYGNGTAGIIGLWSQEHNGYWYLEEMVDRPTITLNNDSRQIEISTAEGTTIRYTTNGDDPTATTGEQYEDPLSVFFPANAVAIKAVAVRTSDSEVSNLTILPLYSYTYNIVDTQGHIAIKYTVKQPSGLALSDNYTSIPEAIRSPYLENEEITYYSTFTEGSRTNLSGEITSTPAEGGDIFVSYTTDHLSDKPLHLSGSRPFKIRVNGEYVYDENKNLMHSSSDGEEADNYRWVVKGGDPYRVQIQNVKSSTHHFKWSTDPSASLTLGATSNFIILDGSATAPEGFNDQVELMAATGADISSNPYYSVGRVSDVGLLASGDYGHGNDAIQVLLKAEKKITTFHIIDMSGRIVVEQSGEFDDLAVPEQWRSPLVQTYHFYKHEDFRVHDGVYTLRSGVSAIDDFSEAPADIYVTYDPSDTYDLDGSENRATDGKKYLLKFADGTSFRQEKSDGFEDSEDEGIYPYINGEGGLFVYGQDKLDATAGAVGSTRTRWAWYLEGGDPYRLRISSLQTKTDGVDDTRHSYLRTYNPQGYDQVVTGVISNTPEIHDASDDAHAERHKPTDYMILNGTGTHFKLVTSDVVDDLDGNAANDVRHTVTSFENYWKTNPTAANVIHEKDNTFSVGDTPTDEQITAALTTGEGAKGWHTYNVWANGSTWASSSKTFDYIPHWFQTIGVGTETAGSYNGDFDLVEYELDGALILLDQHGWEVMRKPITNRSSDKQAYAAELRKYDSPMVRKYHFWTNFIKEDGYHKYKPIRGNETASKNAQHKGVGTSLADYPEVFSGGTLADIYVTYEVMATYRDGYTGAATEAGTNFSNSKYLIRQGEKYAKTTDGSTIIPEDNVDLTAPSSIGNELLWYVKPNFNIDTEMGYKYSGSKGEKTQAETESAYYANRDATVYDTTNGQNGFDPYNLQIESVAQSGKLFTTNATGAGLDNSGGLVSTYNEGAKTVTLQTKAQVFDIATNYYDSGTGYQIPHVTNSTFMAVGDANGNIRLMPRFDHHNVQTSLTILDEQGDAKPYGDEDGTQTTLFVHPSSTSPSPSGDPIEIDSSDEITDMNGYYILKPGFTITKVIGTSDKKPFTGIIDGQLNTIDGVNRPLVAYADGATIKNVILKTVSINAGNADGNAGAICCQATGATRIYNCGILPTTTERDKDGNITGFTGSHVSGSDNVGGIVGLLGSNDNGSARVINCFSYATITGGSTVAGIVGNIGYDENVSITQDDVNTKPMVVNCMFYGDITGGSNIAPVYGGANGAMIKNDATKGVNPYCYFRGEAPFASNFTEISHYKRSWPAEEKYLTRFEFYRSILNSNRRLCTWWVGVTTNTAPTDEDVNTVGIAKWVLDPSIAPYPILKVWGKYPSIINPDPARTWDCEAGRWQDRETAKSYRGKSFGQLSVTVNPGDHAATGISSKDIQLTITDIDTLNCDYGYYKVQLPYYNEQFGDPSAKSDTEWDKRYGGNYKDYVVTGWKITNITGGTPGTFTEDWESGYNFADRNCTNKDLYSVSKRVFAQGGFYYVPEGVTGITIEAYWGKAVYLRNADNSIDRVNVTNGGQGSGNKFASAGSLPTTFQGKTVYTNWQNAIKGLDVIANAPTVYDQAIVLVGNLQVQNRSLGVGKGLDNNKVHPFTIMSADLDLDNEPDFCFELQFRGGTDRPGINPVRFDFLPIPELGLAVRHDDKAYAIGVMAPEGHFEITETAFMRTTQFEYEGAGATANSTKTVAPVILNGGDFEQIVVRYGQRKYTSYFIIGGHFSIHRFTPGVHPTPNPTTGGTRHCAINVLGADIPEFYLSGYYRPDLAVNADNPHCYINGGKFGTVAGAGYEQVIGNVTFKIDHAIIDEFYGGGINGSKPVTGNIDVTIDHSIVKKYCGGPKVGKMTTGTTVTTNATGTTFGEFYGGGNGGTSYYRKQGWDTDKAMPAENANGWGSYGGQNFGYPGFNPLNTIDGLTKVYDTGDDKMGYHCLYEFEIFNSSNGVDANVVQRSYIYYAQFGTTETGTVTNNLNDCTVLGDFYGGGNLGNVSGNVNSTLNNTNVEGSAFGAGYSAAIPSFPTHDKSKTTFPHRDKAGIMHNGSIPYIKDGDEDRLYTWCYKNASGKTFPDGIEIPADAISNHTTFQYNDKWYVPTTVSLEGLGNVTGNVSLIIKGSSKIDGNVFGGGAQSAVDGNTTVTLAEDAEIIGNVFGGGDQGDVTGSTTVNIRQTAPTTTDPEP